MYMSIFLPTVSVSDIHITIPVKIITRNSAEVHLEFPNHSLFTNSTIRLRVCQSDFWGANYTDIRDQPVVLTSDSYSTVFNSLYPNTDYKVGVRITSYPDPKQLRPVDRQWYNFKTQGMLHTI